MRWMIRTLATSVVALLLSLEPAQAQVAVPSVNPGDPVQVMLTLLPSLAHPDARASIIRPAGPEALDMIFVTTETTPADLNRAIRMLLDARHTFGASVVREMQAHVPASDVRPLDLEMETEYLAALQTAAEMEIGGLGRQRTLLMDLEERH